MKRTAPSSDPSGQRRRWPTCTGLRYWMAQGAADAHADACGVFRPVKRAETKAAALAHAVFWMEKHDAGNYRGGRSLFIQLCGATHRRKEGQEL